MKQFAILLAGTAFAVSAACAQNSMTFAGSGDVLTFDPHAHNETLNNMVAGYVYEGLTAFDEAMHVQPRLASSWRYDAAQGGWIFDIRRGVRFHEGEELTAQDCAFSIQRAASPRSSMRSMTGGILEARALGPYTLLVRTASASPIVLRQLTGIMVMNEAWTRRHGAAEALPPTGTTESWIAHHVNGTGPFRLSERRSEVKTVFAANRGWWNEAQRRGNLDALVYRPIKSAATRTAALLSGEVDFVLDPAPQDLPRLRATPRLQVQETPGNRVIMLMLDQSATPPRYVRIDGKAPSLSPFRDRRVREALYRAIDIAAIRTQIMRGASRPTGLLAAPSMEGYDAALDTRLAFDPAESRRLLQAAGYGPGRLAFTLDCPSGHYANDEAICKAIVAMWAKVGVKASMSALPRATFFPKVHKLDTSACLLGYGSPSFDALHCLQATVATRSATSGSGAVNDGSYSNARLDAVIDASRKSSSIEERMASAREALAIARDDIAAIPLHIQSSFWALRRGISLPHRPDNRLIAEWVRIGPDK